MNAVFSSAPKPALIPGLSVGHARFIEMWCSRMLIPEIAQKSGVSGPAVKRVAAKMRLPNRADSRLEGPVEVLHAFECACIAGEIAEAYAMIVQPKPGRCPYLPPPAPFWTPARDAAVIATQGRYADINRLARDLGEPASRVIGRWHLVRGS